MKRCLNCKKKIESPKIMYCSKKCNGRCHYLKNKEKYYESTRKWEEKNPEKRKEIAKKSFKKFRTEQRERFNKLMMRSYQRNKKKWHCRSFTKEITKKYPIPNQLCKKCKSKENLQIHHEIYPTKKKAIEKAIDDGQIYYLCKKCHQQV